MFAFCSKLVKPQSALTLPHGLSNQFDRYAQRAVIGDGGGAVQIS
jgi:hypothetical protein